MKRRAFSKLSIGAVAAPWIALSRPMPVMDRIGMTTVVFRPRFRQTRIKSHPPVTDLTLLEVPEYFADRFKIHNLEFWNLHLESESVAYLNELKLKIARAKSKLINIQCDGGQSLANPDASARQEALKEARAWIDTAAALGSESARVNVGRGTVEACIESFRELRGYAKQQGVLLLTENHGGMSSDPDVLVRIVKEVGGDNFQLLPDYGNPLGEDPYEGLRKILPHARHLISAKALHINEDGTHTAYDFDRCMRIARQSGFPGYYSAEFWDPKSKRTDYENIADWIINHIKAAL